MNAPLSRRALLQAAGALIVTVPLSGAVVAAPVAVKPGPADLDAWIAVGRDGRVTAFVGKFDMGMGLDVAIAQMVGEELDMSADKVELVMGDTFRTVDQGGVSGSRGLANGGVALRAAAAEARRLLGEAASKHLGAPAGSLEAWDGAIWVAGQPKRRVTYAALVGGKGFGAPIKWNGQFGNALAITGEAKPKAAAKYRVVGKPMPRRDVAAKVLGTAEYVSDLRVAGMLHARVILPPAAGAVPVSVDEASLSGIQGAQVVRQKDFLAVLAPVEWDAVRASRALKVSWSKPPPAFPDQAGLYDHIRKSPSVQTSVGPKIGDPDAVFASGARVIEAEYEWPFQSHASLGPACAVADVRPDSATVWTASQKGHAQALGCAKLLGRPPGSVRVITMIGPGAYGRNDAGDAAMAATMLSAKVGKPVRVQGMRHEGTGWDPKGPASVHRARAAVDEKGAILAYDFHTRGFSRAEINFTENDPKETLAGQFAGYDNKPGHNLGLPEDSYDIPARRLAWTSVAPFLDRANPLRASHLRDPMGPQMHFASESFFDEVALATGQDPVAMRLRHMTSARDIAVLRGAAEKAGWVSGPPGARREKRGDVLVGRGVACGRGHGTLIAIVAEVEVTPATGRVWARRVVVAHDCGLVVNPKGLRTVIEGNVVHGLSRALFEEVAFDRSAVTSVDWATYPIIDIADTPETIDIVLLNQPDIDPTGAGEPTTRFVAAAVANAVFDATGVRFRRAPLTPERIKAGLRKV